MLRFLNPNPSRESRQAPVRALPDLQDTQP